VIAITRANLTVRVSAPHPAGGEFSWQGIDEGDERCGLGWAVLQPEGDLRGWLFFHCGDDSEFTAQRPGNESKSRRSRKARSP
jgi:hypothetical protein